MMRAEAGRLDSEAAEKRQIVHEIQRVTVTIADDMRRMVNALEARI
jgi:hypothetical protein